MFDTKVQQGGWGTTEILLECVHLSSRGSRHLLQRWGHCRALLNTNTAGKITVLCLLHNKKVNADEHLEPRIEVHMSVDLNEEKRIVAHIAILR